MLKELDLRGRRDVAADLPRPHLDGEGPVGEVRAILEAVRTRGDAALRELTERFDGVLLDELAISKAEWEAAYARIPAGLREALGEAHAQIDAFHRDRPSARRDFSREGIVVSHLEIPVDRVGLYVPGGRARYPSSVLMTAVPARVAGVESVVCCVPPDPSGAVPDEILAAAHLAGLDALYRVGGAQAIGAMAYGTESIPAVDVIAGPGNRWVSLAQREVRGMVGVPMAFAGPSEVVVIADDSTPVDWAAIDVIVQAEHGPDGQSWFITWSEATARAVVAAIERLVAASPRRAETEASLRSGGYAVLVDDAAAAIAVANAIAPEHLEILTANADELLPLVRHAGVVFLGAHTPAALGDYLAGPSHVLPTFGTARFSSVLGVEDFTRRVHAVRADEAALRRAAPFVATIAQIEGLPAHAEAALLRADASTWSTR